MNLEASTRFLPVAYTASRDLQGTKNQPFPSAIALSVHREQTNGKYNKKICNFSIKYPLTSHSSIEILESAFRETDSQQQQTKQTKLTVKTALESRLQQKQNPIENKAALTVTLLYLAGLEDSKQKEEEYVKQAVDYFEEIKLAHYFHYSVHFCHYNLHLYKGITCHIEDIEHTILLLKRTLALYPQYRHALSAINRVENWAKQQWLDLFNKQKITQEDLKDNLTRLNSSLAQKNLFEGENFSQEQLQLAPLEFIKNHPYLLKKEGCSTIIDTSSFDGSPDTLITILSDANRCKTEIYIKYAVTSELAAIIRYALFDNPNLTVNFYSESQVSSLLKSFEDELYTGEIKQEIFHLQHPELPKIYQISSNPSLPLTQISLSSTTKQPIISETRSKTLKNSHLHTKPLVVKDEKYLELVKNIKSKVPLNNKK